MDFLFFNNSLYFLIFAIISGGLIIWNMRKKNAGLGPMQAVALANQGATLFIDVRSPEEYQKAAIAQARNIPFDKLADRSKTLHKNKAEANLIIIAENNKQGEQAVKLLKAEGYENVLNLNDGLNAWRRDNLPIKKGAVSK